MLSRDAGSRSAYRRKVPSTTDAPFDHAWLHSVVALAVENVAAGGGPFAAQLIRDGALVGRGVNQVATAHDPTAHAEIVAIRDAARRLQDFRLTGCVLVASCEPCPMCLGAALWARVGRVVYAADRHDAADGGFDDLAFHQLFERPRRGWAVPVEQIAVEDATRPFVTWRARADRVPY